jgi:ABC-type multidrug transport system fused ATPase/permease subunit
LVLDEATGALDPATEAEVIRGYATFMKGRTTILITHRLDLVRQADRIVVLRDGAVAEVGSESELFAQGGEFARLFGARDSIGAARV